MKYLNLLKSEKHLCDELQELQKGASYSFCSDPYRHIAENEFSENRTWAPGNPYICACGRKTGWTTNGQPLCPACVLPADPVQYRRDMLAWADEMEEVETRTVV